MIQNAKLQACIKLSSKITLFVPATIHDKEIDNTKQVDDALSLFSEFFGGATTSPALGCWLSNTSKLIKEKTTIVFAYCKESDLQANIDKIVEYCESIKTELQQEAIALEINGEMYFI